MVVIRRIMGVAVLIMMMSVICVAMIAHRTICMFDATVRQMSVVVMMLVDGES